MGWALRRRPPARVTLHTEGVDRNTENACYKAGRKIVTLHTEGVDRNHTVPSSARITEIVTLHTEGVDRNLGWATKMTAMS